MVKMTSGRVVQLFLGFISVLNGELGLGDCVGVSDVYVQSLQGFPGFRGREVWGSGRRACCGVQYLCLVSGEVGPGACNYLNPFPSNPSIKWVLFFLMFAQK